MTKKADKAYVISVSIGTGCYRHIKISASAMLAELSEAILDAFDFFNDHAHAFFMDNRAWSDADSYYYEMVDEDNEERHTCDFTLAGAGVCVDKKFVYVFDFGDDWRFQCKVLKELPELVEIPEIVRAKGEAPPQYEGWDDEDEDE